MKKLKRFLFDLTHPKYWMVVLYFQDLRWKIKDYDIISYDYSCVLDHATCSEMSKTNYELNTIYNVIDKTQSELYYGIIKSDINDIVKDRKDFEGIVEDIKEYVNKL